jgi:hypothetical protein
MKFASRWRVKRDYFVLQTWHRMVEFSNVRGKKNDCFWLANDNDWTCDGFLIL